MHSKKTFKKNNIDKVEFTLKRITALTKFTILTNKAEKLNRIILTFILFIKTEEFNIIV